MTRKIGFVWASFLLLSPFFALNTAQAKEIGCYSFDRWQEAQRYYLHHSQDSLDADRDGWACEELIGFQHHSRAEEKLRKKPAPPSPAKGAKQERSWFDEILVMIKNSLHLW
jgi:hypothetical protein